MNGLKDAIKRREIRNQLEQIKSSSEWHSARYLATVALQEAETGTSLESLAGSLLDEIERKIELGCKELSREDLAELYKRLSSSSMQSQMEWFGSRTLARTDPAISTPYLEKEFKNRKKYDYEIENFMRKVLYGLGIRDFFSMGGMEVRLPIYASENIVPWLPIIVYAIEKGGVRPEHSKKRIFCEKIVSCADMIQEFFAGFPYESAVPHLITALESNVKVKGREVSSRILRSYESKSYYAYGGWHGDCEGYFPVLCEEFEQIFEPFYPIAEGAKKSLLSLSESRPELKQNIYPFIQKYDSKIKPNIVEVKTEETTIGEFVVTDSFSQGK